MPAEVEIKFSIDNTSSLIHKLRSAGFSLVTDSTHELNTLYDQAGNPLRSRGALLRLRQYGTKWTLTYKEKSASSGRHKVRHEIETPVQDGQAMVEILTALRFTPTFIYEKFRSEWSDSRGHVVLDETPIGNFGEIEGPPDWIDATARVLGVSDQQYIKNSYAELFVSWKKRTRSSADHMTFAQIQSGAHAN